MPCSAIKAVGKGKLVFGMLAFHSPRNGLHMMKFSLPGNGWMSIYLLMRINEWIPCFALFVYAEFALHVRLSLFQLVDFLTSTLNEFMSSINACRLCREFSFPGFSAVGTQQEGCSASSAACGLVRERCGEGWRGKCGVRRKKPGEVGHGTASTAHVDSVTASTEWAAWTTTEIIALFHRIIQNEAALKVVSFPNRHFQRNLFNLTSVFLSCKQTFLNQQWSSFSVYTLSFLTHSKVCLH